MKLMRILIAAGLCYTSFLAAAQTSQQATVTDEDLRKYALAMDSVQVMQQTLNQIIAEHVQQNTVMKVQRYNELFKVEKDPAKLTALNATPAEIAFLKDIAALRDYNINRINAAYQSLAKDYVGAKTFNVIRKSLDTDSNLKARYETINHQVKNESISNGPAKGR